MTTNNRDTDTLAHALKTGAGLTEYEADAYTTIVELGSATAIEIADACDVPQARIYDVLRELESEDYIETYKQGSVHARALEPEVVMDELSSQAEALVAAKEELKQRWTKPTLENHRVNIVNRGATTIERAIDQIHDAENEIHLGLTGEQFKSLVDDLAAAYAEGVIVKVSLHPESTHDSLPLAELEPLFEGSVSQVHYGRLPTPFLAIIDRSQVFFTPQNYQHPSHEYGILVNDYSLSHVFNWFFQTALWDPWERVYDDRGDEPPFEYVSIRECLADLKPLFDEDEPQEIFVTVRGYDRLTRAEKTITGKVTDITYSGTLPEEGRWTELITYTEQATMEVATDEQTYSIGGHGTMLEDIEARRITVESVE